MVQKCGMECELHIYMYIYAVGLLERWVVPS
jgi:hypothetical protein